MQFLARFQNAREYIRRQMKSRFSLRFPHAKPSRPRIKPPAEVGKSNLTINCTEMAGAVRCGGENGVI